MRHVVADQTEGSEKQRIQINSVVAREACVTAYKASKVAKKVVGGPKADRTESAGSRNERSSGSGNESKSGFGSESIDEHAHMADPDLVQWEEAKSEHVLATNALPRGEFLEKLHSDLDRMLDERNYHIWNGRA